MTLYMLEAKDAPGTFYVRDARPPRLDVRHAVTITKDALDAAVFVSEYGAYTQAAALPGRWRVVPSPEEL